MSRAHTYIHTAELILQAFSHFTYVTAHSDFPSFLSLHLHHSSFSNPSLALPMSQLILQPFHCFTYVTAHSPTLLLLLLCHRFSLMSPGKSPKQISSRSIHYTAFCYVTMQLGMFLLSLQVYF